MQRATTIILGALVVTIVGVLLFRGKSRPAPIVMPSLSAALSVVPPAPPLSIASPAPIPEPEPPPLPSATAEKKLPANAPRSVRFGVVLIQYRGAQFAPEQAPYKPDALQRARLLAEIARKDFKKAVQQGDPGSSEDTGRIQRNILEPPVEVELFSLAPGAVSPPIDTPRGYWIVRRVE